MHNCVAYTELDKICKSQENLQENLRLLNFISFIFRFWPKMSCIFIFRLFSAKKEKNHLRSTSNKHSEHKANNMNNKYSSNSYYNAAGDYDALFDIKL